MKFSEFLTEAPLVLYRMIDKGRAEKLLKGDSVPVTTKFTSFVSDKKHLKREFGERVLEIQVKDFPSSCKIIPIQYDLAWFTQSPLHKELLLRVTSKSEQDWLDQFEDKYDPVESIDDEIESLYGDEHEIIVTGLKTFDATKLKIV